MGTIPMVAVSEEFAECWRAAGRHLQAQAQGPLSWLRAHLQPPILEHLSFRIGNQLFFICIEAEGVAPITAEVAKGLRYISSSCHGRACVMPMRRQGGEWVSSIGGWGLQSLDTLQSINPLDFVTDEDVEMTPWELQDFAVQIVRDLIEKDGRKLMSWQSNPDVDPSIWFVGDSGPEWVIVRATRFPNERPPFPSNWSRVVESCSHLGKVGHFAPLSIASDRQEQEDESGLVHPLLRGHGMVVRYTGLETPGSV